ncbi:MAG: NYN domain-containing protein [Candidatus Doudnabacteria bacterium]|nr:NYN domain-containing protein [Candidatus Doudnabacteria bacterium]
MRAEQRVGIFVDIQNLYYTARNVYNARVNFGAILKDAVGERPLVRAIAYGIRAQMPEEETFFDAVKKSGFELKLKDLQSFYGGAKKGDWDTGIVMDIIKLFPKLDTIILASGDSDYIPLVEYLQILGQRVELVSFGKSTSSKLAELVEWHLDLDTNPRKYMMPIRGSSSQRRR